MVIGKREFKFNELFTRIFLRKDVASHSRKRLIHLNNALLIAKEVPILNGGYSSIILRKISEKKTSTKLIKN